MTEISRIAVVMDPPHRIQAYKDSTVALMRAAQERGAELYITQLHDLRATLKGVEADLIQGEVDEKEDASWWHEQARVTQSLDEFDVVLMRKDPPVDLEYIAALWLLDRVHAAGTLVVNAPQTLLCMNEKLSILQFPELAPPFLVSAQRDALLAFLEEHGEIVIKPLDLMGGQLVYHLRQGDPNLATIIESLTNQGVQPIMAQRFLPEVLEGDRRLLLINGVLVPDVAVRIPPQGDFRANMARGAHLRVEPATAEDQMIAERLGESLRQAGVYFAGVDVVGRWVTEINITSPTCIREVEAQTGRTISMDFWDAVAADLSG